LHHGDAQLGLDGFQAERAVRAHAGQHDSDRTIPLILGQRPEEVVDRQSQPAGNRGSHELELPVENAEVCVGGDDVHGVRFDRHPVSDLTDPHGGVALDELRQHAGMLRIQVHNHDNRHSRGWRHVLEEMLKGLQPSRRRADAHNGEVVGIRMEQRFRLW
jgi:hypothetical protein